MKKNALILISIFLLVTEANAQYRINKSKYEYSKFTYSYQDGDPYDPTIAGITSFFIPGLGQMISHEATRGFIFLGGFMGCIGITYLGSKEIKIDIHDNYLFTGYGLFLLGVFGAIGVDIWSIIDATNVAKVNNLSFRDKNKTSHRIQIQPYLDISKLNFSTNIPAGLSLKISF